MQRRTAGHQSRVAAILSPDLNELFMITTKAISGCPGYWADTDGNIWSVRYAWKLAFKIMLPGRKLKPIALDTGKRPYLGVRLHREDGSVKFSSVHRLILETFVGKRPLGMQCRHLNGNATDNRLCNLRWGTKRENVEDSIRHNSLAKGESNGKSKVTTADVSQIIKSQERSSILAKRFGICSRQIWMIRSRQAWKHLLTLLFLLATPCFAQISNVAVCASVQCYDFGTGFYQVLAIPAPAGHLKEFNVIAREHLYNGGLGRYLPHVEPTLHLSIYPNLASISVNGMKDYESPTLFYQDFSTNNGLVCQKLTNSIGPCSDLATNLCLLKVPLDIRVYPGAYFGVWFSPNSSGNWTIPPLNPPYGMNPVSFVACRYHYHNEPAYYFKPLAMSGYYSVPYAVYGKPQLQITRTTNGVDVTWGTNDTNLWLTSSQGLVPVHPSGSGVSLATTNTSQLFWLER
jgi:hypothetical protein